MANKELKKTKKTLGTVFLGRPTLSKPSRAFQLGGAALLFLLVFVAYYPSLHGGFLLDDNILLTQNSLIKLSDGWLRFWTTFEATPDAPDYWPVTNTSLWIEWRLWGMDTFGYHCTNTILHFLSCVLIWAVLRRLSIPGSFLAAALFAVHPVNIESIAWISQRKNVLSLFFFLIAFYSYLRADEINVSLKSILLPRGSKGWYAVSFVVFLLAVLSKASTVTFPALMLVALGWRRTLTRRDLVRIAPFFAAAAILTVVNVGFARHGCEVIRDATVFERFLGAGAVVWFYLYKALLPINLLFIYPQWTVDAMNLWWWIPLAATLATTFLLGRYRANHMVRPFWFAWLFFCLALVPVMGFADVGFMQFSLVADRYLHIAILGLLALVGAGWNAWRPASPKHVPTAVAVILTAGLAWLCCQRNVLFADAVTLYANTLEKNSECWSLHQNLGIEYREKKELAKAKDEFDRVLELKPNHAEALCNLGNLLMDFKRPAEAIVLFRRSAEAKPSYANAYNSWGVALVALGKCDEGIERYKQAISYKPGFAEVYNNWGVACFKKNRPNDAVSLYQKALSFDPWYFEAHRNWGALLQEYGKPDEALFHFQKAIKINPADAASYNGMGLALIQLKRIEESIAFLKKSVALNPQYADAYNNLGVASAQVGMMQDAVRSFEEAVRWNPGDPENRKNLAVALASSKRPEEAVKQYRLLLEMSPGFLAAYLHLANCYVELNRNEDAVASARKGLETALAAKNDAMAEEFEQWLQSHAP